jgi:hypothetical protein
MGESETRCCTFRLDPRGFVRATIRDGASFDLDDAKEAVAATWHVAGEQRRAVLVDMRGVRAQSRQAREYFDGVEAARILRGVALLVGSPLSRVVGNFFVKIGEHRVPTRLFNDEADAETWVLEHIA